MTNSRKPGESFWKEYEDKADEALRTYSGPKNPRGAPKKAPPKLPLPQSVPGAKRTPIRYVHDRDTTSQRFKSRKV